MAPNFYGAALSRLCFFLVLSGLLMAVGGAAEGEPPAASLRLILVRHAEAVQNLPNRAEFAQDQWDALSAKGAAQAAELARQLKGTEVVAVIVSSATRAKQTAAPIAETLNWKGKIEELAAFCACGKGEAPEAKDRRAVEGAEALATQHNGKTVLVVTHQHIILAILERAAKGQAELEKKKFSVPPGSVAEVLIEKGQWKIVKEPAVPKVGEAEKK